MYSLPTLPFYYLNDKLDKCLARERQPKFWAWLYPRKYPDWKELTPERLNILVETIESLVGEYLNEHNTRL